MHIIRLLTLMLLCVTLCDAQVYRRAGRATHAAAGTGGYLRQVENGTVSLAANDNEQTVTLATTLTDITKAILTFSCSVNSNDPSFSMVAGSITNTTTLTFTRNGTTGAPAVTIEYYVAEFSSGVTVQRGIHTAATETPMDDDVTINTVDATKAFPIISLRNNPSTVGSDDFVRADITSSTNLKFTGGTTSTGVYIAWQVVQFDSSVVRTGDVAFLSTDASKTATITSSSAAKTWLLFTYDSESGTGANIGQKMVNGVITDATTLTFSRLQTGTAINLTYYAVVFTDNTTAVQHGNAAFGTGDTQKDETISTIDATTTIATASGWYHMGGECNYTADDILGTAQTQLNLSTTTNLQLTRALHGSVAANVGWNVVKWVKP